jgi:hypothetical protein
MVPRVKTALMTPGHSRDDDDVKDDDDDDEDDDDNNDVVGSGRDTPLTSAATRPGLRNGLNKKTRKSENVEPTKGKVHNQICDRTYRKCAVPVAATCSHRTQTRIRRLRTIAAQ